MALFIRIECRFRNCIRIISPILNPFCIDFLNKLKANDSISKITPSKKKIDAKARKQLKAGLRKSRKAAPRVSEERKNS